MHRHGITGRKLSLDRDQRQALIRGQVTSLVLHEQIQTTVAKAKEIAPHAERLITRAKKGGVVNLRIVNKTLLTENAVQKMMYELAPAFEGRNGGYTRIVKLGNRRGDNAPMAIISLVLPAKVAAAKPKASDTAENVPQEATKKTPAKVAAKPKAAAKAKTAKGAK
jgi:large subunit ribosomal protein L17